MPAYPEIRRRGVTYSAGYVPRGWFGGSFPDLERCGCREDVSVGFSQAAFAARLRHTAGERVSECMSPQRRAKNATNAKLAMRPDTAAVVLAPLTPPLPYAPQTDTPEPQ